MKTIRAIETCYRGFLFRSRLEARYAVYLDWMHVQWEYEKEGYLLKKSCFLESDTPYLPDFWLPDYRMFLEVKGQQPTKHEQNLCSELREQSECAVALFSGLPAEYYGTLYCWDLADSSGGTGDFSRVALTSRDRGDEQGRSLSFHCEEASRRVLFAHPCWENEIPTIWGQERTVDGFLSTGAARMARSARFEHGENPAPLWLR